MQIASLFYLKKLNKMFQNKNNQTTDGSQTNLSQKHDLPIEDLPVHTMKKDLEAIKNPKLAEAELEHQKSASLSQPISREKLTEAQKGSPFLDFSASEKSTPALKDSTPRPEIAKPATSDLRINFVDQTSKPEGAAAVAIKPASKPETPVFGSEKNPPKTDRHPHHVDFGKVFAGVIAVLIIAIIAGGGYYFWITRQSTPEVVVTPPVTEPEPQPEPEPAPEPIAAKFLTGQPNTLAIDSAAATSATLKESLQNYAKDVADEKVTSPVEFVFAGADEKLIAFKDFAKILGITLSPALAANLSDTFSLFIYNDNAATRLGLAIDSKDPVKLKSLMMLEEKTLAKTISPIFLVSDYTLANKPFAGSDYNGLAVRYMNITSPEDLSVDYAIYNNKLVIGTTRMTLRSVIDYLKPQTE